MPRRHHPEFKKFIVSNITMPTREMYEIARVKFGYSGTYQSFITLVSLLRPKPQYPTSENRGLVNYISSNLSKPTRELYADAKREFGYTGKYSTFRGLLWRVRTHIEAEKSHAESGSVSTNQNEASNFSSFETSFGPRGRKELSQEDFIRILKAKRGHAKILDLCKFFECTPGELLSLVEKERQKGVEIIVDDDFVSLSDGTITEQPAPLTEPLSKDREIKFAVVSDLHFGSKSCQITALNEFCEDCRNEGVKIILVAGDCVAGYQVYKGQQYEVYAETANEQEESLLRNLPTGFEWYIMGGNHDQSFIKNGGGHNPLFVVAARRPDITFLGFEQVIVPVLHGVDLLMWHPSGGGAYALSYKMQKFIEQNAFKELKKITSSSKDKPTLRFVVAGHFHTMIMAMFGSICGLHAGCFEGETSFTRSRGWVPQIGGWIIHAWLNSEGNLESFIPRWYAKREIENDWKNFIHSYKDETTKLKKPLFEK